MTQLRVDREATIEHPAELPLLTQPDERGWDRPDPLSDPGKGGGHLLEPDDELLDRPAPTEPGHDTPCSGL